MSLENSIKIDDFSKLFKRQIVLIITERVNTIKKPPKKQNTFGHQLKATQIGNYIIFKLLIEKNFSSVLEQIAQ